MERGTVKFFNRDRLYGFIVPDGGGPDIWFHFNDCRCFAHGEFTTGKKQVIFSKLPVSYQFYPKEGDRVVFERATGKGAKPKACPWNYETAYERQVAALHMVTWVKLLDKPPVTRYDYRLVRHSTCGLAVTHEDGDPGSLTNVVSKRGRSSVLRQWVGKNEKFGEDFARTPDTFYNVPRPSEEEDGEVEYLYELQRRKSGETEWDDLNAVGVSSNCKTADDWGRE